MLNGWGCRVGTASDGQQALDTLRHAVFDGDAYDIAVLDMQMPVMDGETLGCRIKNDRHLKKTMLLMLTPMERLGDAGRMKEIGFAACLTKPIKHSQLYDCLAAITGEGGVYNNLAPTAPKHIIADKKKQEFRVLLAEDNRINQQLALKIIQRQGYQVDAVSNGSEVIKALEMNHYDLVLMDIQMPEMDGFETTAEIRNDKSNAFNDRIPIIALTANAMKGDREQCMQAGMDDYITKPIDPVKLTEKIEHWILNNSG